MTSTLDITIYDESIIQSMKGETLGKISIPLLRINNNEKKWYALKDRSKKHSAKGNCPRILLEMSLEWNPVIFFYIGQKLSWKKNNALVKFTDKTCLNRGTNFLTTLVLVLHD